MLAKIRPKLAVALARLAARLARLSKRWGGTSLPGKVALKVWPTAISELSRKLPQGCVLISGTNGKTTTARVLSSCAQAGGVSVCANTAGANLTSGVATALLALAKSGGRSNGRDQTPQLGIFEVDEAALPEIASQIQPRLVVLLNLFRDQLDRHGELEAIASRWQNMIAGLGPETQLLVNADDPGLVAIAAGASQTTGAPRATGTQRATGSPRAGNVSYFGLDDSTAGRPALPHAADITRCRACRAELEYDCHTIGHLGDWSCPDCDWHRPPLDYAATGIKLGGASGHPSSFEMDGATLTSPLPGLHNIYNCLAAATAARLLDIPKPAIAQAVERAEPAFGRAEEVLLGGSGEQPGQPNQPTQRLLILLAKNPTGANENIHTIAARNQPITLLLALNDRVADGHDVSWIWDVDYEPAFAQAERIVFTGDRAFEMALRYRYGSHDSSSPSAGKPTKTIVLPELSQALSWARDNTAPDGLIVALPTYTATLELRAELSRLGVAQPFWEQP